MPAEENMALVRRWFSAVDAHDFDAIDELLAEDYVDHSPSLPDQPPGREGVRQTCLALIEAFPDTVHQIVDQTASGDMVMTRLTTRCTWVNAIHGFQPTGKVSTVDGTSVHRVVDGKLVEHWATVDMVKLLRQISQPVDDDESA